MTDDTGLPNFQRITAIVAADDADRLAAWCERTELPADVRQVIGNLNRIVGWDHQQILLGAMLINALTVLESAEQLPKEET